MKYECFYIFISLLTNQVTSEASFKQLHVVFRHGERSPSDTFPADPYINITWPGGWGQLTNRGKMQIYKLGQIIRSDYNTFIPKIFWHKDVNFTSSYHERCLMSAQLFAAGLYPPINGQIWNDELPWNPIPITYTPRAQDTNIVMKAPCAKYDQIFREIRSTPDIVAIENKYTDLKKFLTNVTGMNITNIEDIESVYNTLDIELLHNLTLPRWVNESLMATMKELAARNLALYSETQYMKKVKGGVFLNNMLTAMEKRLNGTDETKLYLYAVHDLTIVHILRSLDLVDDKSKPGFGATIAFELYSDGEVAITYRDFWSDSPSIMVTPHCSKPCMFQEMKSSLAHVLCTDYNKECELDNTSTT